MKSRFARLLAAALLGVTLTACPAGGEGPTQPDIEREPPPDDPGLEEDHAPVEERAPEGEPGPSPIEEPDTTD